MKPGVLPTIVHPRTLIVGIHSPYNPSKNIQSYYEEFINLVKTNGIHYEHEHFIKLRTTDSAYLLTKGKLEEVIELCKKHDIQEVIFSEPLTAQQERNLGDILKCRVFDRNQLILEIFEKGAHSAEGKIQVEIAMAQHQKSRLAGRGIHMSQQGGKIGTRGPGETAKEKMLQHIEHRMHKLRKDLAELAKHRELQRKRRLDSKLPLVCLVGYTNAGKSTILNTLTHSDVLAEDKPFATLDTTTRELFVDGAKKGLISDTVGFIQQIPHKLIEAFKSTLSELQYAHLLLHVIDISDPNWESQINVVEEVLKEIGVDKPMLYVFNKIDKTNLTDAMKFSTRPFQPSVFVSGTTSKGLEPLVDFLRNWYPENQ